MTITDARLAISEVAVATGLSTHTLRYYERAGLMRDPVDRASSSHRRYTEADIGWVSFLTKLRTTAMPIATVREYAELVREGDSSIPARYELLKRHREVVAAQLEEVTRSLAAIDYKIATYEDKAGKL